MDFQDENYHVHIKVARLEEKMHSVQLQHEKEVAETRNQISGLFKRIDESLTQRNEALSSINTRISSLEYKLLNAFRIDVKKIGIALFIALGSFIVTKVAEGWFQQKMMNAQVLTLKVQEEMNG